MSRVDQPLVREVPQPRAKRERLPEGAKLRGRLMSWEGPTVKDNGNEVYKVEVKIIGREDAPVDQALLDNMKPLRHYVTDGGEGSTSKRILEEFLFDKVGVNPSAATLRAAFDEAMYQEIVFLLKYETMRSDPTGQKKVMSIGKIFDLGK